MQHEAPRRNRDDIDSGYGGVASRIDVQAPDNGSIETRSLQ